MHKKNVVIMKTAREIHKGNKNRLNLPLHKFVGVAVRFSLAALGTSLYGGSLLVWFVGLWLAWNFLVGVVRFLWVCLVFLFAFVSVVAFIVWVLTL